MHLYALTLQRGGGVHAAIYGSFSAPRANEVVVARGHTLELLRTDETGHVHVVHSSPCFAVIRSLLRFRVQGQEVDHVVVGTDAGVLSLLRYDAASSSFTRVACEPYGRTGCRRITPGEYVAGDARGRAIMLSAVEKGKLVYLVTRSGDAVTVSSPLEAHKSSMITFDVVGLDVGFDNPTFAALELEYAAADGDPTGEAAANASKMLVYYEVELGLNSVTRKWSRETDRGASKLIPVPGAGASTTDGPGGVLVLAENLILYEHNNQPALRTPLPRRDDMPDARGLLIISAVVHKQKPGVFFFLLQSELGDVYKVTLEYDPATGMVSDLIVAYYDTIPPATALAITRSGLLFAAAEFGNHFVYNVRSLGEGDTTAVAHVVRLDAGAEGQTMEITVPVFRPRPLTHLEKVDEVASLAPVLDMRAILPAGATGAVNAFGATPYFAALCGRGPRSTLRVLREGLAPTEIAVTPMPGNPMAVFSLKATHSSASASVTASSEGSAAASVAPDKYIVISFNNATLVLAVGETVEEIAAKEIGFIDSVPTLAAQLMADDSFLQVYPGGARLARAHGTGPMRTSEWRAPAKRVVVKAAANARQLLLALSGGDLLYFELDDSGALALRNTKTDGSEMTAVAIGAIPPGRLRAPHCAVADASNMVRVFSLDPTAPMTPVSSTALKAPAESLAIVSVRTHGVDASPHLFIGLANGVLTRVAIDAATGMLSDPRSRFLGLRAVRSIPVTIAGVPACLSLSTRPWLSYAYQGKFYVTPLAYDTLESAAGFVSEVVPEGIVAIAGNTLRIFTLDRLGETFTSKALPLRYTPRRMATLPLSSMAVIVESDHNAFTSDERVAIARLHAEASGSAAAAASISTLPDGTDPSVTDPQAEGVDVRRVGPPLPAETGKWASAVRVVDLDAVAASEGAAIVSSTHPATHSLFELPDNEAAVSVAHATFHDHAGEQYVLVGTVRAMQHHPRSFEAAFVHVYRIVARVAAPADGDVDMTGAAGAARVTELEFVHKTAVEEVPYGIASFMGRVLVGVGSVLRLYDLGKKKLLRKTEARGFPTFITSLQTSLDRIFVADAAESVHFVKYKRAENALVTFADDFLPRYVTSLLPLDHDTIIASDKFGNVFVLRVPADVSDDVDNPTGSRLLWDAAVLNGAPNKCELVAQYYVGEVVTTLSKATMAGGSECVFFATVHGTVGALLPLVVKEDIAFCTHLEIFLRNEGLSLVGRDHLSYRSVFMPVKDVVDGDLCATFAALPPSKQASIASDLERTPQEVLKKLEDLRNKIL